MKASLRSVSAGPVWGHFAREQQRRVELEIALDAEYGSAYVRAE